MSKNTGKPYDKLTQKIFSQIVNQNSVQNINVQHDITLPGKTTSHQIDVYWEFEVGGLQYQTVIQAKDWKNKVKKEQMLAFKAILDDLPSGTKGVFVSKSGFQSGAIEVAQAHGIKIFELRKPTDSDWIGKMTELDVEIHLQKPYANNLALELDKQWVSDNSINIQALPLGKNFHQNYEVINSNKVHVCFVWDIVKDFLNKAPEQETYCEKIFDDAFIAMQDGCLVKIKRFSGHFGCRTITQKVHIDVESVVGMILVDILSGSICRFDKNNNLLGGT